MKLFDYEKHLLFLSPDFTKLNDWHCISSGSYIKLKDMYDEHLLQSIDVFHDNQKFYNEMTRRLFYERMKTSSLAQCHKLTDDKLIRGGEGSE